MCLQAINKVFQIFLNGRSVVVSYCSSFLYALFIELLHLSFCHLQKSFSSSFMARRLLNL